MSVRGSRELLLVLLVGCGGELAASNAPASSATTAAATAAPQPTVSAPPPATTTPPPAASSGGKTAPPAASPPAGQSGAASSAATDAAVSAITSELRQCYTAGQRDDPMMRGRMQVRAKIAADGSVASAEVTEATGLTEYVVRCVVDRVRAARFPPPEGGHDTVLIPATFEPKP